MTLLNTKLYLTGIFEPSGIINVDKNTSDIQGTENDCTVCMTILIVLGSFKKSLFITLLTITIMTVVKHGERFLPCPRAFYCPLAVKQTK